MVFQRVLTDGEMGVGGCSKKPRVRKDDGYAEGFDDEYIVEYDSLVSCSLQNLMRSDG